MDGCRPFEGTAVPVGGGGRRGGRGGEGEEGRERRGGRGGEGEEGRKRERQGNVGVYEVSCVYGYHTHTHTLQLHSPDGAA